MGRTKRTRSQKKHRNSIENLSNDPTIIELSRWMTQNNWHNESKLILGNFVETGRGIYSKKSFKENDVLIDIPFNLLITFITLQNSEYFNKIMISCNQKFYSYDLISLYLVFEKHLGEEDSFWYLYLKSLPEFDKNKLLWYCEEAERKYLDGEILKIFDQKLENFNETWDRVNCLIQKEVCSHCKIRFSQFLTRDLLLWAYNIVCTRAMYVDPNLIRQLSNKSLDHLLLDDPSTAVCPFLDMFNHSVNAQTTAGLRKTHRGLIYRLITKKCFEKYEQIFISYGEHNNKTLITEYGFVLSKNQNDFISFTLEEILSILKIKINKSQYKFLNEQQLNKDLFIFIEGCSYFLVAVLYVFLHENEANWSSRIYSSSYTKEQLSSIYKFAQILLENKLKIEETRMDVLKNEKSYNLELYKSYLRHRITLIKYVLESIVPKWL